MTLQQSHPYHGGRQTFTLFPWYLMLFYQNLNVTKQEYSNMWIWIRLKYTVCIVDAARRINRLMSSSVHFKDAKSELNLWLMSLADAANVIYKFVWVRNNLFLNMDHNQNIHMMCCWKCLHLKQLLKHVSVWYLQLLTGRKKCSSVNQMWTKIHKFSAS